MVNFNRPSMPAVNITEFMELVKDCIDKGRAFETYCEAHQDELGIENITPELIAVASAYSVATSNLTQFLSDNEPDVFDLITRGRDSRDVRQYDRVDGKLIPKDVS